MPDLAGLRTRCGDWTTADLEKAIAGSSVVGDAVESFRRNVPTGSGVAFCASVAHARVAAAEFDAAGISAAVLTGADKREHREAVLEGLASGTVRVLCSVDVISEGFDLPDIRAALLLRPTQSLGLYLQQVGRALRPSDGKIRAVVLDHSGNALRHGLPSEDREWSLEGIQAAAREMTHTESGEALSVRQCLTCYAIHPAGPVCPYCGTEHPRDERIPRQRAGELRRLEAEEAARIESERKAQAKEARTLPRFVFEKMAKAKGWKPGQAGEAHRRHVEKKAKAAGLDGGSSIQQADWLQGKL
ncbi:DEAD/DEAH box helicase [Cereibacter johrii]|uniref:DEAD/DEAH box helicase n=1 Tax=Cereibacter johrii TaxID=445629 RepID=UPI002E26AD72